MNWKDQITIPNILTIIRLACVPWMAREIYVSGGSSHLSAFLFLGIWCTDVLDGWIARHFNQVSDVGKLLDPLVDKIFQITTGVMMVIVGRLPVWVPVCMVIKEIIMVIGGAVMLKHKYVVSAAWYGKLTTVLFAFAFATIFFLPKEYIYLSPYIFILPLGMMVFSLLRYAMKVISLLKNGIPENETRENGAS